MECFELSRAIERFARELASEIRNPRRRRAVTEEYREHMEDATYQYMLSGMAESDAFAAAVADLGNREKVQTLLAVTHNGDGAPRWFRPVMAILALVATLAGHLLAESAALRTALGFVLAVITVYLGGMLLRRVCFFLRALGKRVDAKRRIRRCADENGWRFTEHKKTYAALLFPGDMPEWVVEGETCCYIIRLLPTFGPNRLIHFHENGLYTCAKLSGFLMKFAFGYMSGVHAAECELPRGIYRFPVVDFKRYHVPGKENIHILLLNPAPYDMNLSKGGRVCALHPDEPLTASYGYARACTASDLIRQMSLHASAEAPRR